MKSKLLILAVIALATALVFADSWGFEAKLDEKTHEYGQSRIVLATDTRENQQYPEYSLSIYLADELMARYRGVAFDQIFASDDHTYFVGLSNHGLTGTAFVIFDRKGNLIREMKHRFMDPKFYTSRSVTVIREWYNDKNPAVQFQIEKNRLRQVTVNGSAGTRYNLLDRTLKNTPDAKPAASPSGPSPKKP
jgi:hypothetical protein